MSYRSSTVSRRLVSSSPSLPQQGLQPPRYAALLNDPVEEFQVHEDNTSFAAGSLKGGYSGWIKVLNQESTSGYYSSGTQESLLLANSSKTTDQTASWRPGFWKRFPISAVASLLIVVVCTGASIAILVLSNGQNVDGWGYGVAPSVYLSVLSIISNTFLAYALTEGLTISFWRTMLHGCTVSELSTNWLCGSSVLEATAKGYRKGGKMTAIACILCMLSILRGPLNQRASSVHDNVRTNTSGITELQVAKKYIMATGVSVDSRASVHMTARMTSGFTQIMLEYSTHTPMNLTYTDCGESCSVTVNAFGFNPDCNQSVTELEDSPIIGSLNLFNSSVSLYVLASEEDILSYSGAIDNESFVGLLLQSSFVQTNTSALSNGGIFQTKTTRTCKLVPSIMAYTITLSNGVANLSPSYRDDVPISPVDMLPPSTLYEPGGFQIGGFQYAGSYLFLSWADLDIRGAVQSINLNGALANQMLSPDTSMSMTPSFGDPMDGMVESMREIAFRTALRSGVESVEASGENGPAGEDWKADAVQRIPFEGFDVHTIYRTEFLYVIIATLLSMAGVVAVGSTLYGWWQLGRDVSLNPLETAKAFGALILRDVGSNVSHDKMPQHVIKEKIRYGADLGYVHAAGQEPGENRISQQLVVGKVDTVRPPTTSDVFD